MPIKSLLLEFMRYHLLIILVTVQIQSSQPAGLSFLWSRDWVIEILSRL